MQPGPVNAMRRQMLCLPGTFVCCLLLQGCFFSGPGSCEIPPEVMSVRSQTPVVVPDDLDALDESKALKVPEATTPPRQSDECLDKPPRYEESG